jgi:transmembrane sensor
MNDPEMNDPGPQSPGDGEPTPAVFAEAAAWMAYLHGPNRTLEVEKGLRRWLDADPTHASAFEAMTAAWEVAGRLPKPRFPHLSRWQRAGYRDGFIRSATVVAVLAVLAFAATFYLWKTDGVTTAVGEQRLVTLDDGTRVFLNTATHIVVKYDRNVRKVVLKSGEALFDIAKKAGWPFMVEVADQQVRALGTSFIVREDEHRLSVTLVEGKVTVSPANAEGKTGWQASAAVMSVAETKSFSPQPERKMLTLVAGQRLTWAYRQPPELDTPPLERVTAWQRGLVDFENTPLAEAVAEMNRYSAVKLVVTSSQAFTIPITGVFRAGDASSFAAAVARAYQLQVAEDSREIRLSAVKQ